MKRLRALVSLWPVLALCPAGLSAQDLQARYRAVLTPPMASGGAVENVAFTWAGLGFLLQRGQLQISAPVEGRVTAAVFTGTGELDVTPADGVEAQQIALRHAGQTGLKLPFTQAVFRFANGDNFVQAIAAQIHLNPLPAPVASPLLAGRAHALVAEGQTTGIRLLASLSAPLQSPVAGALFLADVHTRDNGWIEAEVDPLQDPPVRVHAWVVRPYSDSTTQIATSLLRWEYNEPSVEVGGATPLANTNSSDPYANADFSGGSTGASQMADGFVGYASITDDPTAAAAEHPSSAMNKSLTGFDDTWTAFTPPRMTTAQPWDIRDLQLDMTVGGGPVLGAMDLAGNLAGTVHAQVTAAPLQAAGSLLLLRFDSQLRVSAVTAAGAPLQFIQPPDPGDPVAPTWRGGWLAVLLPTPATPGTPVVVSVAYSGKMFEDLGAGNYRFRGGDWYPSALYGAPSRSTAFDLRVATDRKLSVAASGVQVSNQRQGDRQVAEWKTTMPLSGFGLVLGDLQQVRLKPDPGLPALAAFVNRRPDMAFAQIAASVFAAQNSRASTSPAALKRASAQQGAGSGATGAAGLCMACTDSAPALLAMGDLTPAGAASGVLGETQNELEFLTRYFGPFPYSELRISNLPARIVSAPPRETPAWPQLVCLSNAAFLDALQQHVLGLDGTEQDQLDYLAGAHAVAHQWWNGSVGWASDRDLWLGEGLASAGMLLYEESRLGHNPAANTLHQWRDELEKTDIYGHVPADLGALSLGPRLRSPEDPAGWDTVATDKGGYVLYMLRELMRSNKAGQDPDAAFIATVREFAAAYSGRAASTAGFQAVAERHLPSALDLDGSGKLDWFFDAFVRSAGIPHLQVKFDTTATGGKTTLTVHVANPGHYRGFLPVDVTTPGGESTRILVRVTQDTTDTQIPLPFNPTKVAANAQQEMLLVVE